MFIWQNSIFSMRPFRLEDAHDIYKNLNDKEIIKYLGSVTYPYSLDDAKLWLEKCQKRYRQRNKICIPIAIIVNNEVIGSISFNAIDGHKAEVGFWLAKKHHQKGIMTQALKNMIKFGFNELGLTRIYAHSLVENIASQKTLLKAGFKKEGKLIKHHIKDGKYYDVLIFGITN